MWPSHYAFILRTWTHSRTQTHTHTHTSLVHTKVSVRNMSVLPQENV